MSPVSRTRRFRSGKNEDKTEVELARYELNPQYCGTLLYFMQYAEQISNKEASALEHARV